MDANGPDAAQSLRFKIQEIDAKATQMRADGYRRLLQSLVDEGTADVATSMRPASQPSQPRTYPQPSSSSARGSGIFVSRGRRLTRSQTQALITRNEGPGRTSSRVSVRTISTDITHEDEAANDEPDAIRTMLAGLTPYPLSGGERESANKTPKIGRPTFSKIFGPFGMLEWFACHLQEDYKDFFCYNPTAQPFAPKSIGDQGLALLIPGWTQDDEEGPIQFHAFMSGSAGTVHSPLKYMGDYTKVPLLQKTIQWSLLPEICQDTWLKRLYGMRSSPGRVLRARIKLRDILKREPSVAEVRGRLQGEQGRADVSWAKIRDAFISGKEKMRVVGIKCERYDMHLASIITMGHGVNVEQVD